MAPGARLLVFGPLTQRQSLVPPVIAAVRTVRTVVSPYLGTSGCVCPQAESSVIVRWLAQACAEEPDTRSAVTLPHMNVAVPYQGLCHIGWHTALFKYRALESNSRDFDFECAALFSLQQSNNTR